VRTANDNDPVANLRHLIRRNHELSHRAAALEAEKQELLEAMKAMETRT
jgi:hypothetical protein